jgi:hypothetical protein
MPPAEHPEPGAGQDSRESVYAAFLAADIRPLIRSAAPDALRAAHDAAAAHLHGYVAGKLSRPWDGDGQDQLCLRPAFGLFWQAEKAAAATLMLALAAARQPARPAARPSPERLRATLLDLADAIDALYRDASAGYAATAAITPADLPDDEHAIGLAVAAAASLHFHAARSQAIHLLCHLWTRLDPGIGMDTIPGFPGTAPFTSPGYHTPLN